MVPVSLPRNVHCTLIVPSCASVMVSMRSPFPALTQLPTSSCGRACACSGAAQAHRSSRHSSAAAARSLRGLPRRKAHAEALLAAFQHAADILRVRGGGMLEREQGPAEAFAVIHDLQPAEQAGRGLLRAAQ